MSKNRREIARKMRVLQHAEETGDVAKTCRYFGVGRTRFYRWQAAYRRNGEEDLINKPSITKWHVNRTPIEIDGNMRELEGIQFVRKLRFHTFGQYHTATGRELACNET